MANVIDDTSVSLLRMEFDDWLSCPSGSLSKAVSGMLRDSGVQGASDEQVGAIAGELHAMAYSVVDDTHEQVADILRRNGFTIVEEA